MNKKFNLVPKLIGIDPGYDRVGWAILTQEKIPQVIQYGCIQTNAEQSLSQRYQALKSQLSEILCTYKPNLASIESLFFATNAKTAMPVSEARGVIISCCLDHALKIFEYTPLQVKATVTGNGHADKKSVEKMIRMQLRLPKTTIIDDAIDAIAIGFTHCILQKNHLFREKYDSEYTGSTS